ncbi:MAG: YggT family protein [Lachnospiraceae bacterium]|nr:YggT family protein [Lachnospiraceae bacterium]
MFIYIISTGYWFFRVIEIALFIYIIMSWLPVFPKLQALSVYIMEPLLAPVRRIIEHSVLKIRGIDLSPIVLYLLAAYASQMCYGLR